MPVTQASKSALQRRLNLRLYLRQQPVMFAIFFVITVIFFLFVTELTRVHYAQREALGQRWFNRGVADLNAKNYAGAVTDFRSALLYSPDKYDYQLNLAEALIGLNQPVPASAYLLTLWDREPDNGVVNLDLARIAAKQGRTREAIRYYHDAVYAAWPSDQDERRHLARLELIELELQMHSYEQAQAELIALSENVRSEPSWEDQIGDLFLQAGDPEHALGAFQRTLKTNRHDEKALAGAGTAAFRLAQYSLAEHYLLQALAQNPKDTQAAEQLKTAQLVLQMDPYRRPLSEAQRRRLVMDAFAVAGQRLQSCPMPAPPNQASIAAPTPGSAGNGVVPAAANTPMAPAPTTLSDQWAKLKPKMRERELRMNPDLEDAAMDLVFRIERQTSVECGAPTGKDLALTLIAKLHEGM